MDGKTFADKGVEAKGACDGSYNTVDKTEVITQCPDGVTNLRYCASTALNVTLKTKGQAGVVEMMAPAPPAQPFCLHHVDVEDHKCFEYCQMDGKTFADKGVEAKGACDGSYNTVDKTEVITQCPDGVTNLRYCASTALNVTLKTKGQAGVVEMMAPEDNSAYCMNDKSKHAPFYCHCPPLPTNCKTDKDCSNPWFKSYCMNDASKKAPFVCKQVMPPTCTTDKDCQR